MMGPQRVGERALGVIEGAQGDTRNKGIEAESHKFYLMFAAVSMVF
jgi:hypothetical protein